MSSINDVRVAYGESAEAKEREGTKERAHHASGTAEQREERKDQRQG